MYTYSASNQKDFYYFMWTYIQNPSKYQDFPEEIKSLLLGEEERYKKSDKLYVFIHILEKYYTPLNIYNETPEGVSLEIQGQPLPINELNGTPPNGACAISNLHQSKESVEWLNKIPDDLLFIVKNNIYITELNNLLSEQKAITREKQRYINLLESQLRSSESVISDIEKIMSGDYYLEMNQQPICRPIREQNRYGSDDMFKCSRLL